MRASRLALILFLLTSVVACGWLPKQQDETKNWSASRLYSEAKSSLNSGDYQQAIKYFETLEGRYPFGRYAQQAQLEVAYAYYKYDEPDSAVAAADRFIKLHPQHPHVDYAYYLKGLINFNRGAGLLERFFPQDPSERDPGSARQAFLDFRELVTKFPNSRYAQDALLRMNYLRNNLAKHEVKVARYYMRRKAYVAVVNRCKYVVEHYDRSPSIPDALFIMAEAYDKLKLPTLAGDARRVLKKNFPRYQAVKQKSGWWPF
jgi:outer membrane protein assembly factor BamD